jgi:hypothetical protein
MRYLTLLVVLRFGRQKGKNKQEKQPFSAAFLFSFILLIFQSFEVLIFGSFGMAAKAVNGTGTYGMEALVSRTVRGYRSI